MEGYFPIHVYTKLANVSRDTAYHRMERKEIPSFKDENGVWFAYYNDEGTDNPPEGYIFLHDFAKKFGVTDATARFWLKHNKIKPEDVIRKTARDKNGLRRKCILIKEDVEPDILTRREAVVGRMEALRPEGYITVTEFAKKENKRKNSVYIAIRRGAIEVAVSENHYYIKEDATWPKRKRREK